MTTALQIPNKATYGEKYGPAMELTDPAEAASYFAACVLHTMRLTGKPYDECAAIERSNLGYYSGYYGMETQERVERLFAAPHPIFGPVGLKNWTTEDILRTGMIRGLAETQEQEECDLLAALLDKPADQGIRNALTDWYIEHGVDPKTARCFIPAYL